MCTSSIFDRQPVPTAESKTGFLEIPLTPRQARAILKQNTSPQILVVCRGYNQDTAQFTELVWADDANLDFEDHTSYPEFQLWVSV